MVGPSHENPRRNSNKQVITALKEAFISAGYSEAGVSKLNTGELKALGQLCSSPESRKAEQIKKMFNAVSSENPEQIGELVTLCASYPGQLYQLDGFLKHFATYNPFSAARRAQIQFIPQRDDGEPVAIGASGVPLKIAYALYDPEQPNKTVGFNVGRKALFSIFSTFNKERNVLQNAKPRPRTNNNIKKALEALDFNHHSDLRGVSLDQLLAEPDLVNKKEYPLISRNLEVYQALRDAISEYSKQLSTIVHGDTLLLPTINAQLVESDPGRGFFGWFEEHFKENPQAPIGLQIAVATLLDSATELTESQEQHYLQGLLAYKRSHSHISSAPALEGIKSDIEIYEHLAKDDPLAGQFPTILASKAKLQNLLQSNRPNLTLQEYGDLLGHNGLVQFRAAMNARAIELYGNEFYQALRKFDFVAFDADKSWREDAHGRSAPMKRLEQHLYGAKIGVQRIDYKDEQKRGLLDAKDFKQILEALFLIHILRRPDTYLNAKPIKDFHSMVETIIVAHRKACILDKKLEQHLRSEEVKTVTLDSSNVGTSLACWKPVLPFANRAQEPYRPVELWKPSTNKPIASTSNTTSSHLSLKEIVARFIDGEQELKNDTNALDPELAKHAFDLSFQARNEFIEAGLYQEKMNGALHAALHAVKNFMPAAQLPEGLIDKTTRYLIHPLVVTRQNPRFLQLHSLCVRRYLSLAGVQQLEGFVRIVEQIGLPEQSNNLSELVELRTSLNNDLFSYIFKASLHENKLLVETKQMIDIVAPNSKSSGSTSVWVIDPKLLASKSQVITSTCIKIDPNDNTNQFQKKLRLLLSRNTNEWQGPCNGIHPDSWNALSNLPSSSHYFVTRQMTDLIDELS